VGTAYSHGWAVLAPNRWDATALRLERTERLGPGRVVTIGIEGAGSGDQARLRMEVRHAGELSSEERARVREMVRRMFRLDEDLEEFYAIARSFGGHWTGVTKGRGRLLRSPTVFEDAVKTICTTNVQWKGTKAMVRSLVETLGEPGLSRDGSVSRAFPTPEAIAGAGARQLESARLGYRARYVRELAERIVTGETDLESLRDPDMPLEEIQHRLHELKGVGPYAAATLLMLLGRYEHLAVDSVFRDFVGRRYFDGDRPGDEALRAVYEPWGRWKYLGYWFDLWAGNSEEV
jgi:3-methyladenine DNA glycosylase/8-oxoguanine DNA glycosylase